MTDSNPLTNEYRPSPKSPQSQAIAALATKLRNPPDLDGTGAFIWDEDLTSGAAQALVEQLIPNWAQATIESPQTYRPHELIQDLHDAISILHKWSVQALSVLNEANEKGQEGSDE